QKARELIAIEKVKQIAEEAHGTDFDSAPPDEAWKQIAGFFGLPVEFEAPEEERKPWATWLLSAAVICVSLLAFPHLRDVVHRFAISRSLRWRHSLGTSRTSLSTRGRKSRALARVAAAPARLHFTRSIFRASGSKS